MYKNMNEVKVSAESSFPLYQTYISTVISKLKSGPPYRRQVVHALSQTPQRESVAKLGRPQLTILSLVGKWDIKYVHSNLSNPLTWMIYKTRKQAINQRMLHGIFYLWTLLIVIIDIDSMDAAALIARFMGPTWGPSGADRTPVGPMLVPWTLQSVVFWKRWEPIPLTHLIKSFSICLGHFSPKEFMNDAPLLAN